MSGKKINIAIIGAGKIAFSLTAALINSGYNISTVISRNINSAEILAKKYSIPRFSDKYADIPVSCKFIILCVPDSEIKKTAMMLSRLKRNYKDILVIHLSGAENISLLDSLKKQNARVASLHIMQTFPSLKPVKISGCYSAIETDSEKIFRYLKRLSEELHLIPFRIKSNLKTLYHLAGVYSSNFLSGNMLVAKLLFNAACIKEVNSEKVMMPIVNTTINNIEKFGPEKSLSGPVERGDILTVKKHLASLEKLVCKEDKSFGNLLLINYINQSLMLLKAAEIKYGSLTESHLKIRDLLSKELGRILFVPPSGIL